MCYIKYFETSVTLKWDTIVTAILEKFETSLKMRMRDIRKLLSTRCPCYIKYIEISLALRRDTTVLIMLINSEAIWKLYI